MEPSFDRGEIDRASLDATERLRARLAGRPTTPQPPRRRSVLPWVIAGGLFVFAAGMIANPWFEGSVRNRISFGRAAVTAPVTTVLKTAPVEVAPPATAVLAGERLARTEAQVEINQEQLRRDDERIERLNSDISGLAARVDTESSRTQVASATAIAAADRAQAMIVVLLARDALAAGRRLNGVEPVLRQSFESRYPQAVASVVALGAAPVTLAELRRDFAGLDAVTTSTRLDWWQSLTSAVRSAISRPADGAQAPQEAAAAALARGDIAAAANHLRRVTPRSTGLSAWLAAADRWQTGMAALATLEAAAIMPPTAPAAPTAPAGSVAPAASVLPAPAA